MAQQVSLLTKWPAYAAAGWAFLFAGVSFYWAAGGTLGANTLGDITKTSDANAAFTAIVWLSGLLKALAGVLALALVRRWGRHISRWILLTATWVAGGCMALYGVANLLVRALMGLGVIPTPASMHTEAARWHLLLWDPWWLLGGVLFCVAAWNFGHAFHRAHTAKST